RGRPARADPCPGRPAPGQEEGPGGRPCGGREAVPERAPGRGPCRLAIRQVLLRDLPPGAGPEEHGRPGEITPGDVSPAGPTAQGRSETRCCANRLRNMASDQCVCDRRYRPPPPDLTRRCYSLRIGPRAQVRTGHERRPGVTAQCVNSADSMRSVTAAIEILE